MTTTNGVQDHTEVEVRADGFLCFNLWRSCCVSPHALLYLDPLAF